MVALMSAIVYFEIFCDEEERARKFYSQLFGWKVESIPGTKYCNITTQEGAAGGLTRRFNPHQKIINYFGVPSVQQACSRVEALGGRILVPRMAVPKAGYYALCMDSENNLFGLWEEDPEAEY
ncbi:MAG: VOC family protein [Methanothrix sp.]|nr:VOC family protein [Methanothrix sp.]